MLRLDWIYDTETCLFRPDITWNPRTGGVFVSGRFFATLAKGPESWIATIRFEEKPVPGSKDFKIPGWDLG